MKKLLALLLLSPLVSGEDRSYDELKNSKAMAVNIETGESFSIGSISVWDPVDNAAKSITKAKLSAISKCDKELKSQRLLKKEFGDNYSAIRSKKVNDSKCIIFRVNNEILYKNVDDYFINLEMIAEAESAYKENQEYAQNMRLQNHILYDIFDNTHKIIEKHNRYISVHL